MTYHSSVRISRQAKRFIEKVLAPGTQFGGFTVMAIRSGLYQNDLQSTVEVELSGSDGTQYVWDVYKRVLLVEQSLVTNAAPDFLYAWHPVLGAALESV